MSFTEMIPGRLYVGGRISSEDWRFIDQHINAIVNLRTKPDRPPFDFTNRVMIWTPITIKVTPSIAWVENLMAHINLLDKQGYSILIHDTYGYQRLGFIIAAYYMQRFRMNRKQALSAVQKIKPDIQPTANYLELLARYEKHLGLG
ncbi:dual specificity protein phosphatase family protein [Bacillus sp. ISL-35]|uniref:protein-tyrosine phosphatase family protein n=1 Tax=Bacillus sp. ISL-35 TaxID=2819122 RepID=UPI001BEB47DE|nr:dual specificity protein phosphatase family protein [Bacillus sp. ISL-35]MBT2681268.1 dual specificity protein phosphatase family protein [Bacillus sp. ISL-35]MBT2705525.1 dual specificity protein phosphatase family protein [Chryseobacterium sp. ISL-80]